ncbi:hypothetical protein CI105_05645 [Candidatus Izimaplasma bacterium ZiA1]|uniref:helix-hairpin-helix domain-containing protein n=1 Tax=Candidatus Izimoplasma sp. ZiA1 TaxID=2024899 RepID=UPI000BAA8038|nr:hypothetical protein CI105_05645 [Candidatus Izimaplasma bacterium ZiA1]
MKYINKLKTVNKLFLAIPIIITIITATLLTNKETPEIIIDDKEDIVNEVEDEYIYIDIKGCVNNPGVYKIRLNSRLFQALELAGGLTNEADTLRINLSLKLDDEAIIYIPSIIENEIDEPTDPVVILPPQDDDYGLVNINTASMSDLETLKGIGPSTAEAIINYRETIKRFDKIEDIMNVSGIGEATFNSIKDDITV